MTYKEVLQWQDLIARFAKKGCSRDVLLGLFASSFAINLLSLAFPIVLLQTYDRIIPNEAFDTLTILIIGVLCALVLEASLRIARTYVGAWADARFEFLTGCKAFKQLLSTPLQVYEHEGTGVYLERLNAINLLKDFYAGQALVVLLDIPFILLFLGLIAYISGYVVLVPIVMICLYVLRTVIKTPGLKKELTTKRQLNNRRTNFVLEVLTGIHSVKALTMEAPMLRRYERLQQASSKCNYELGDKLHRTQLFSALVSQATMVAVAAVGGSLVAAESLSVGALVACILLSGRCLQPISKLLSTWNQLQAIQLAEDHLEKLRTLPTEHYDDSPDFGEIQGYIALRDVSFRHRENLPFVLKDINLKISPGKIIGIQGDSLSGKSTLLSLIMGTLKPTRGEVYIDSNPISGYNPQSLRKQITYLPQDGVLFKGTIMDNLTQFQGKKYQRRAKKIASMLGLHNFISQLPEGYDTRVGDASVDYLPRGIKQQLIIARALLNEPRIVLFDEANSAVDRRSDEVIKETLAQLQGFCTLIIVSHRPSLLALAERIYKLQNGSLICMLNNKKV